MTPTLAFGDDRSPAADICWNWINQHKWSGWRLEVVTAQPREDMRPVEPTEAELHPWQPDQPRTPADKAGFEEVEHLRTAVDPRLALIARPWDLVAIGPKGSGLLKTLHLGSTAEWLIQEPTSPLVIARRPEKVEQVLLGADGSAHALRAAETLAKFPWIGDVAITVIAVDDGRIDTSEATRQIDDVLGEFVGGTELAQLKGNPTTVLLREIEHRQPDLVALGARGLTGIRRLILGSTAAAVTKAHTGSVLIAHA